MIKKKKEADISRNYFVQLLYFSNINLELQKVAVKKRTSIYTAFRKRSPFPQHTHTRFPNINA